MNESRILHYSHTFDAFYLHDPESDPGLTLYPVVPLAGDTIAPTPRSSSMDDLLFGFDLLVEPDGEGYVVLPVESQECFLCKKKFTPTDDHIESVLGDAPFDYKYDPKDWNCPECQAKEFAEDHFVFIRMAPACEESHTSNVACVKDITNG